MDTYIIIGYPEVQDLMKLPGFEYNACAVSEEFADDNPDLPNFAWFVKVSWLDKLSREDSLPTRLNSYLIALGMKR